MATIAFKVKVIKSPDGTTATLAEVDGSIDATTIQEFQHVMDKLIERGVKNLAIVTPGFSADCLETLEEIAGENAEIFRHHGGKNFAAIPCLNDSDAGMEVIEHVVRRELEGWIGR